MSGRSLGSWLGFNLAPAQGLHLEEIFLEMLFPSLFTRNQPQE